MLRLTAFSLTALVPFLSRRKAWAYLLPSRALLFQEVKEEIKNRSGDGRERRKDERKEGDHRVCIWMYIRARQDTVLLWVWVKEKYMLKLELKYV